MRHSLLHHRTMHETAVGNQAKQYTFRQSKLAHDTSNRLDGGEEICRARWLAVPRKREINQPPSLLWRISFKIIAQNNVG